MYKVVQYGYMTYTVNASAARSNFFDILDRVYAAGESFLVKKSGIPVAVISKPVVKNKNIMEFAGVWKDVDADKMIDFVYAGRSDKGKLKRKLPNVSS